MILAQIRIQKYWFGDGTLKEIMDTYEIRRDHKVYDKVVAVIEKSKKQFIKGFSFFTREDIDKKVLELISAYPDCKINKSV